MGAEETRPINSKRLQKTYHGSFNEILKYVTFNNRTFYGPVNFSRFATSMHISAQSCHVSNTQCSDYRRPLKADSHISCRAHAIPMPCRTLIHTCHAATLPCSDSVVSFVKDRVVAGNIRTASPTVKISSFLYCAATTLYSRRYGSL
jgi:hypothetical protein